ncbi:hypothetical protein [Chitinophaga sp. CB10]|uniref:hypothetical protein n=1 Tax=Chitinophaga sp. CB10 TaxID=1891659 RepID=UPI0025BCAE0C|nr:hypothetical protein [Chitinophaga sp. CB10]
MKKHSLILLLFVASSSYAQQVYQIRADSAPYINSIMARDEHGYAYATYFNTDAPTENGANLTRLFGGYDNFIRPVDATAVRKFLGVPTDGETLASVSARGATTDSAIWVKNKTTTTKATVLANELFARGNYGAQSDGHPSYGFHIPNKWGMALYLADNGQLRVRSHDGVDGQLWHSGNDGETSGLDADLLRGRYPNVNGEPNTIAMRDQAGNLIFENGIPHSGGLYWGNHSDEWKIFLESSQDTPSGNLVLRYRKKCPLPEGMG